MVKRLIPLEQALEEAENPRQTLVDPDDLVEINPEDLDDMLDEEEDDEE